jgi:hypothetical protein
MIWNNKDNEMAKVKILHMLKLIDGNKDKLIEYKLYLSETQNKEEYNHYIKILSEFE